MVAGCDNGIRLNAPVKYPSGQMVKTIAFIFQRVCTLCAEIEIHISTRDCKRLVTRLKLENITKETLLDIVYDTCVFQELQVLPSLQTTQSSPFHF